MEIGSIDDYHVRFPMANSDDLRSLRYLWVSGAGFQVSVGERRKVQGTRQNTQSHMLHPTSHICNSEIRNPKFPKCLVPTARCLLPAEIYSSSILSTAAKARCLTSSGISILGSISSMDQSTFSRVMHFILGHTPRFVTGTYSTAGFSFRSRCRIPVSVPTIRVLPR